MMKKRKHIYCAFSFLLIAVMLFLLAACGLKRRYTKIRPEQGNRQQIAEASDGSTENTASSNVSDNSECKNFDCLLYGGREQRRRCDFLRQLYNGGRKCCRACPCRGRYDSRTDRRRNCFPFRPLTSILPMAVN